MKIQPDSPSAERLMKHDVRLRELDAAHIFVFDWQAGAAITLPFPIVGPVILIKRKWLVYDDEDELADDQSLKKLRHEFCHVRQILDWGGPTYMRRQVWARFKTRNLYAKAASEESACYSAEDEVEDYYRKRNPA